MRPSSHLRLLLTAIAVWLAFWLAGLPDYYQQYSQHGLVIGSVLITLAIAAIGVRTFSRGTPERRLARAAWMSLYFTLPLALLDVAYCGIYLGHGAAFLTRYWYLSIFYVIPWLLWLPTAGILARQRA